MRHLCKQTKKEKKRNSYNKIDHFKVVMNTFTVLCSHQFCIVPKCFVTTKRTPISIKQSLPTAPPSSLWLLPVCIFDPLHHETLCLHFPPSVHTSIQSVSNTCNVGLLVRPWGYKKKLALQGFMDTIHGTKYD